MTDFWQKLPKPFTVLAPMDDVTDNVFRQIVLSAARPDVFFTEFVSADGLVFNSHGIPLRKLTFTPNQHPIVAQIWGTNPEMMGKAAKIVRGLGFDGIDINMGCPIREVVKKGAGAGLIGNYNLSEEIIKAVKRGAEKTPVSVKTRLGINENIAREWTTFLLKQDLAALTVHGRIAKQMSKGLVDWEEIGEIVKIKNEISPQTLIIGNGNIKNYEEAVLMSERHGVDGVMIGRGVFSNPWVFSKDPVKHTKEDYYNLLFKHIDLFEKTWGESKNFNILKKFFKMYIKGFKGANMLRQKLMEAKSLTEIRNHLR
jgi:nifR3 family TIM-barrel protein